VSYGSRKGFAAKDGDVFGEAGFVREETRKLPVDGIKEELVAHGQAGQVYRHLYFHIGCRFLGWPGTLASWLMHQVDMRQVATGRMESAIEIKDNLAAFACSEVLVDRSRRRISRRLGGTVAGNSGGMNYLLEVAPGLLPWCWLPKSLIEVDKLRDAPRI
jgi:hypothetical protein